MIICHHKSLKMACYRDSVAKKCVCLCVCVCSSQPRRIRGRRMSVCTSTRSTRTWSFISKQVLTHTLSHTLSLTHSHTHTLTQDIFNYIYSLHAVSESHH